MAKKMVKKVTKKTPTKNQVKGAAEKAKLMARKSNLELNAYRESSHKPFQSLLGPKDIYSIRLAGEVSALIEELRKLPSYSKFSNGEIIEHALVEALKAGLLCSKDDRVKIGERLNQLRAQKAEVF